MYSKCLSCTRGFSFCLLLSAETLKIQFEAGFRGENCSRGVVRWLSERTISKISRENFKLRAPSWKQCCWWVEMEVFQRMGCKKAFIKSTKVSPPASGIGSFFHVLSAHDRISQGLKLGWSGAQTHWPHTHKIFGQKNGFKSPRVSGRPRPAFNSEKNENKFEWISFHAGRKCVERHFISTVSSLFEVFDNGLAISCWQFEFSMCERTFWSILWCFCELTPLAPCFSFVVCLEKEHGGKF